MKTIPTNYLPCDVVIFGVAGDLSRRKLIPALYRLFSNNFVPEGSTIIGVGRKPLTPDEMAEIVRESLADLAPPAAGLQQFCNMVKYLQLDLVQDDWSALSSLLKPDRVRMLYMAIGSEAFAPLCNRLAKSRLVTDKSRLVVEKPIGRDLQSARELSRTIHEVFTEQQIFRIDHYLGKETVQNVMALRFANALFEPLWNSRFIDHVQITVAESIGAQGRGYYDQAGAMRDMMQNHLMQLLCLTTMEPPYGFNPDAVRDEKLKVLRSLQPIDEETASRYTSRGQYAGYPDEAGNPQSTTETYVAIKTHIENWRWSGTPFYLRTGKALAARVSEIAIAFKALPHSIFPDRVGQLANNELVIRVQPDEGIVLQIMVKDPKRKSMGLIGVPMDMTFAESLGENVLSDAYERLLLDVIRDDQTLFMRYDEVETAWQWIDPIIRAWQHTHQPVHQYARGSQGPGDASRLISQGGDRFWRDLA